MKKYLFLLLSILTALSLISCAAQAIPSTSPSVETDSPAQTSPTLPITEPTVPPITTISTEPPTQPTEVPTEPIVIGPEILDSPAYQRLISLFNAEYFDPAALAAIARWIDSQEGFMDQYPEGWKLRDNLYGPTLACFSPRTEDSRRYGVWIDYLEASGTVESMDTPLELFAMDVSRDWVIEMVHSAEDPIGVPDAMKDAFADFLIYHDMYPGQLFWPETELEMYFGWTSDSTGDYITLFIKYYDDHRSNPGYFIASAFFNGVHLMEGYLDKRVE